MVQPVFRILAGLLALAWQGAALASPQDAARIDLTNHPVGIWAIAIFILAYLMVIAEEFIHLRKSKPVVLAAGLIWLLIAVVYNEHGLSETAVTAMRHNLLEYAELMLFLMVAMTYINALEERNVFAALRGWLVNRGFSFRQLFWLTGLFAFALSPIADNLTTALVMCAVVLAVGGAHTRFVSVSCINIVVAANAGGAFSPFGDITTLMVWQGGKLPFLTFFYLLLPSLVNFLVPAAIMHFAIPKQRPTVAQREDISMLRGARRIILLFLTTITLTVCLHQFLHFPAVLGMMTGLGLLKIFSYYLIKTHLPDHCNRDAHPPLDIFTSVSRIEWDTLLFFYGVIMCVGGLGFMGYLTLLSTHFYEGWGATSANIAVGLISAVVDNIPVMFAVLSMDPQMSTGQWLLVTLTAGVGGSLLSIGSAAGVALMGQAKGAYTFFSHLKWTPAIALGYTASIATHMWLNAGLF